MCCNLWSWGQAWCLLGRAAWILWQFLRGQLTLIFLIIPTIARTYFVFVYCHTWWLLRFCLNLSPGLLGSLILWVTSSLFSWNLWPADCLLDYWKRHILDGSAWSICWQDSQRFWSPFIPKGCPCALCVYVILCPCSECTCKLSQLFLHKRVSSHAFTTVPSADCPECIDRDSGGTGVQKSRLFNKSWLLESSSEKILLRIFYCTWCATSVEIIHLGSPLLKPSQVFTKHSISFYWCKWTRQEG